MQKSSYPPEIITVKVQNNAQAASKKSVFQRLGSKSAGDLSLEEQCKELRRQIKMEGSSTSARKRAPKRHKESSSSSEESSSGSSDSSSSSSSSQSTPTRRRTKRSHKAHRQHHADHLSSVAAAKLRKTTSSSSSAHLLHRSSAKPSSSSSAAAAAKLPKKHKSSRLVESTPPLSSARRRSTSPVSSRSKHHQSHELKKRDHHRSKEALHTKQQQHHETSSSRGRSRSPRSLARPRATSKRRLTPRGHSPRGTSSRSLPRNRSVERDRERREKDREEREVARNKEREEALLRCQERQRERERVARDRERKERSREKSPEREKQRLHRSTRDLLHETLPSSAVSTRTTVPRASYERRTSPPAEAYEFESQRGHHHQHQHHHQHNRTEGQRVGMQQQQHHHHRESVAAYEKEYVVVRGERSPQYEEAPLREKYRGGPASGGYEYEPRSSGGGGEGGRMGGGYSAVAVPEVRNWAEEEKGHKAREAVGSRERGNKWEGQKFAGGVVPGSVSGSSNREELWHFGGGYNNSGGGGHHKQPVQHQGGPGPGQQQQQQQPPLQQGPPRMMGPRYGNDSWHHKPRFGAKKEFYPRHQFQHEGDHSHVRYPNQQHKRFGGGEYQQSFVPRGMMSNQGPKFNAPAMHGHQSHHPTSTTPQQQQLPAESQVIKPRAEVVVPAAATAPTPSTAPSAGKVIEEDVGTPTEDEKKTVAVAGGDDLPEGDNLSEFSDDGDDILDKNDSELTKQQGQQSVAVLPAEGVGEEAVPVAAGTAVGEEKVAADEMADGGADQDDLTLDFEEISDGELEEDPSKVKGLGDALGVDWAGLVAAAVEPREAKEAAAVEVRGDTAKEMWRPQRIFKDVGISVRMAGWELAERLLGQKGTEGLVRVKKEPMEEGDEEEGKREVVVKGEGEEVDLQEHPVASCQVAFRRRLLWRSNLMVNSVALCARRDLQLRRQLCGLPAQEIQVGGGGRGDEQQQNELRALAMEVFAKATAAVH